MENRDTLAPFGARGRNRSRRGYRKPFNSGVSILPPGLGKRVRN